MVKNVGKETMIQQMTTLMNQSDGREVFPNITCLTLLLTGRQDGLCTVDIHKKMQQRIKNSQLAVIENSGHMTTLEKPEEVLRALRKWLIGD